MGKVTRFIDPPEGSPRLLVAIDGRVKLLLLLGFLLVNLAVGGWRVPLLLAMLALLGALMAGVGVAPFLRRMVVPALLAAVVFFSQVFWARQGEEVLLLDLGGRQAVVYEEGARRGLELSARILGGMGMLLFFSLSTPLPELMRAARFYRVPAVLVELALVMYRYLFLLLEEAGRIRTAQAARLGFGDTRSRLRSAGILGGMLVLRTYDRAERGFAAMRCRGYCGSLTPIPSAPLQRRDWGTLGVGAVVLAFLLVKL